MNPWSTCGAVITLHLSGHVNVNQEVRQAVGRERCLNFAACLRLPALLRTFVIFGCARIARLDTSSHDVPSSTVRDVAPRARAQHLPSLVLGRREELWRVLEVFGSGIDRGKKKWRRSQFCATTGYDDYLLARLFLLPLPVLAMYEQPRLLAIIPLRRKRLAVQSTAQDLLSSDRQRALVRSLQA